MDKQLADLTELVDSLTARIEVLEARLAQMEAKSARNPLKPSEPRTDIIWQGQDKTLGAISKSISDTLR